MIKTAHIITDLNAAGAQVMLYQLLAQSDRTAFEPAVVSLTDIGPIGDKIRSLDIPITALGMRPGVPDPARLLKLARWLGAFQPAVIQTWLYHADLIGGLAARLSGGCPVAWGIHMSNLEGIGMKRGTRWTARACARLSRRLPTRIVCCSEASVHTHQKMGYPPERMIVIPNGFDLETYRPDPKARLAVRQDLRIPAEAPLIGLAARFNPQKDHRNFVQAAALLHAHQPDVYFVLFGQDIDELNQTLMGWIETAGLRDRIHLLGRRKDVPRLCAALDIATLSSVSEAFPMVIGEAMACGVPCVVTDVGDSALLVGDTGRIVPPKNPQALAHAWRGLIEIGPQARSQLGRAARERIAHCYSLAAVTARYEDLYRQLANCSIPS